MVKSACVFNHYNKWRVRWDYIVMLLACLNCFMVPVEIAVDIEFMQETWYKFINLMIDTIFILDIFANFNTSFEENQETVFDRKRIAKKYIKTRFTVDVLSAMPLDFLAGLFLSKDAKELKALSLLKLIRMLRLSRIIRALNVKRAIKSKVKLLQVFLILLLYLHCSACLLWFIISYEKLWINPTLKSDVLWSSRFYSDALHAQYLTSMHFSLLGMFGTDI